MTAAFLHIPHAEDIPNTVTVGNGAGFFLRPYNFFDHEPSVSSDSIIPRKSRMLGPTRSTPWLSCPRLLPVSLTSLPSPTRASSRTRCSLGWGMRMGLQGLGVWGEGPGTGEPVPSSPSSPPGSSLSSIVLPCLPPLWDHPEAMLPESGASQLCAPQQAGFLSQRRGMVR